MSSGRSVIMIWNDAYVPTTVKPLFPTMVRIATVKVTGRRYVVQQICFRHGARVFTWGERTGRSKASLWHQPGHMVFQRDEVEIVEQEMTVALAKSLNDESRNWRKRVAK